MPNFDFRMVLEYAKVFAENADYGDENAPAKSVQGSIARKGGQTIVNAYFTSDADLNKLIESGLDLKPLGHDRILEGNSEYGIGQFIRLKRNVASNERVFENKGKEVTVEYGLPPKVIDFRDPEIKAMWEYEKDGELGNGTEAIVRFSTYSNGSGVRLEAIAVTNLVEWVQEDKSEYADVWDV